MILYPNETKPTNEWRPQHPDRPLVFLDVDGVINWSPAPLFLNEDDRDDLYKTVRVEDDRYFAYIALPFWMPKLVNYLTDVAEVVWLTAWKEQANPALKDVLGIEPLPTVIDGTDSRFVAWKSKEMAHIAWWAHERGREVIWIEDFGFEEDDYARQIYKGIPHFVHIVDTLPRGVLTWEDLEGTPIEPEDITYA